MVDCSDTLVRLAQHTAVALSFSDFGDGLAGWHVTFSALVPIRRD